MPLLLALWFSNPLILWGLGAASLPILIHLLNRRKYREMPWAAMRFLIAAVKSNQRRVRLEQWILLAVRTLVILLAVLAMARPFLESLGAVALLPGQRTHWVLVIDGSLSMATATTANGPTRFDQAREFASQIVRSARPGDGFSLVLLADPSHAIIGAPAFQREAILQEIAQASQSHSGIDPAAGFRKLDEVLESSDIARKEIVILTDLQASSWNRPSLSTDANLKRILERWTARNARSTVIDLGSSSVANRSVVDLAVEPSIIVPNAPVVIRAALRAYGPGQGTDARVQLVIDGRLGPEEIVRVEPGQPVQAAAFPHQFSEPGDHVIEVRLDADSLPLDDVRRLVVPVIDSVKVLLVDGDPNPEPLKSDTSFLLAALAPPPDDDPAGGSADAPPIPLSPMSVETVGESQLLTRDLSRYNVVILANLSRVTRAEADSLRAFVDQGGGLVVFGGDRLDSDNYNQVLHDDCKALLPAAYGPVVGDPSRGDRPFELDPLGFRHPIVALYAGEGAGVQASLTSVKTARYHRLQLPEGSPARVALAFSSGDPAVIDLPRKRGRVLQVATTADPDWTTWPLHQSFPPVMEQLVLVAASGQIAERNFRVGQPLTRTFPLAAAGVEGVLRRPGQEQQTTPIKLQTDGDVSLFSYTQTDLSGLYRAQIGGPVNQEFEFAVNPDPAESDTARLDAAGLRAAIPGWEFVYEAQWKPLGREAASVAQRGEIHRPLLWALLGLLLTESFLAWKFGHQKPRKFA